MGRPGRTFVAERVASLKVELGADLVIANAENAAGWKLEVVNYPEVEFAKGRKFDGIIGRISEDCHAAARKSGVPVVNVQLDSPVAVEMAGVYVDFRSAGRVAAEHLIARGMRSLAHFGYTGLDSTKHHYEGVREVAQKHGVPCTIHRVSILHDADREHWERFSQQVMKAQAAWKGPLGVAMVSDELCRAVSSVCLSAGWVVPDQMAMVGSGNDQLICASIDPTLSSVDMGYHQCGYDAAQLLDRLMRGEDPPDAIQHSPPRELVVRKSSDVFAVSDPQVARALRHMADNAGTPLSVPEIAQSAGLGRHSLERRFRKHVGRTINEELIRLRVSKLKRLLLVSEEPVKTLSDQAGFGTTVSMHTMFKRHTGMTPKEYRLKFSPRPERDEQGG